MEVEEDKPPTRTYGSHTKGYRDEELTVQGALSSWRDILDYEDEEGNLGYPQYVRDRVRDAAVNWTGPEVTTMLVAHQQLQSLERVQIAEILQTRIYELRREHEPEQAEEHGEETSMMRASMTTLGSTDGISTYGLELQFLTDELSGLPPSESTGSCGEDSRPPGQKTWSSCWSGMHLWLLETRDKD